MCTCSKHIAQSTVIITQSCLPVATRVMVMAQSSEEATALMGIVPQAASLLSPPWEQHVFEHVSLCHQPCPRSAGCPLPTLMPRIRCQDHRQDSWCMAQHAACGTPMCMTQQCHSRNSRMQEASAAIPNRRQCTRMLNSVDLIVFWRSEA